MDSFDQTSGEVPALDAEATADALDVLEDLPEWELVPARWERVRDILDSLEAALRTRDPEAAREAIADLELSGPVRVTRIGTKPTVPEPEEVRDRRNRLVFSLGGDTLSDQEKDHEQPDPD
ncbi:CATRA system-associated protein [Nonomuraea fuscirosea]|uniref:CATRA system-associated protein n=1 Tax=Nonomuraea fuscirosea TaxID=1291556 RepID=UPI0033E28FC3